MGFFTAADGDVIGDSTVGIDSACSRTRIDATVTRTALIARAVRIEHALRTARAVRIADIISRADAIDGSVLRFALSVGTARIGIARFRWFLKSWCNYDDNI